MAAPLVVINPATGQSVAEYPAHAPEEVRTSARQAAAAWEKWRRRKFADRAEVLRHAARLLRRRTKAWHWTRRERAADLTDIRGEGGRRESSGGEDGDGDAAAHGVDQLQASNVKHQTPNWQLATGN